MALEFEHVFTRKGVRAWKKDRQPLVDDLS